MRRFAPESFQNCLLTRFFSRPSQEETGPQTRASGAEIPISDSRFLNRSFAGAWLLLSLLACDKQEADAKKTSAPVPTVSVPPQAEAKADASLTPVPAVSLPERPIPKPQSMVTAGMSIEVQQKAIAYMVAMRAPQPGDASADPTYAGDLIAKLKPISLAMDTGADKARMNRVEMVANGRQIDMFMSNGCDERTAQKAVIHRAGLTMLALASHGVLVVRCNDARVQCLQSTRDPEDVLCTTAPRHK